MTHQSNRIDLYITVCPGQQSAVKSCFPVQTLISVDRENTCSRALCECDLQFVKDIVANDNKWKRSRHLKFGFDTAECVAEPSIGLAARGKFI